MASNASFSDSFVLCVCFVVHRSPRPACLPWAHSSCRGEQVGPAERANHSFLNWKVTCARPVTWVVTTRAQVQQKPQQANSWVGRPEERHAHEVVKREAVRTPHPTSIRKKFERVPTACLEWIPNDP
jgi:hypothetical protein